MHPSLTDSEQMVPDADWNCWHGGLNITRPLAISFFLTSACQLSKVEHNSRPQLSWHQGPILWKTISPWLGMGMVSGWFKHITFITLLLIWQEAGLRQWCEWWGSAVNKYRWSFSPLPTAHLLLGGLVPKGPVQVCGWVVKTHGIEAMIMDSGAKWP